MWKDFENLFQPDSREAELLALLDPTRLPAHVAVIMDGNGRWAKARNLSRVEGHNVGAESVRIITETAARLNLGYLTLYAFSVENWKRPETEVSELMRLLKRYLQEDLPTLQRNNIRFRAIGRIQELDFQARNLIRHAERATSQNTGLNFQIAINYGGRSEIEDAVREIARKVKGRKLNLAEIDTECIASHLYTSGIPDPDLLIRTSGEYRISNFLLWQIAYAEIHITPVLWPDFRAIHLFEALLDFQKRERRFGGVGAV